MFRKSLISAVVVTCLYSTSMFAQTLQEDMIEVLNTNPTILQYLKNFRATQQDLNIAESEYYPTLDLTVAGGYKSTGHLKKGAVPGGSDFDHNVQANNYLFYESSLVFTQNLFDGFGTSYKIDYQQARILAAAYKYLEVADDTAFRAAIAYIELLKSYELIETARQNLQINETIYEKVKDLFEAGLTTDSEVKKIQSTVSLARSNLTVEKNNASDNEYKYRRILGRMPEREKMQKPILDVNMPASIERAGLYAINNNSSLMVSRYDIKGAESLWKQRKKDLYPVVDLELSQVFNDNDHNANGFTQADDTFTARVVMTYNLFRGGSDDAYIQQHISKIAQEVDIQRELKREVTEGLDLSWNAYYMVEEQLKDLRDYSKFSEETLELYKEEYDLGRRSLLDLLSAQSDVINSRSQIIEAEYAQLMAKYRILDAMGVLVLAVTGDTNELRSKVNLQPNAESEEILDTVPIKYDVDNDNIADNIDLCDNSKAENNIMPYGCKKRVLGFKTDGDDDEDGVLNSKDLCPDTPAGVQVDENGCCVDTDQDGVCDYKDECQETPIGVTVDEKGCCVDSDEDGVCDYEDKCRGTKEGLSVDDSGCPPTMKLRINYETNSASVPELSDEKVGEFAQYMNENTPYNAKIVGHTDDRASDEYNMELSNRRADGVRSALIKEGVSGDRLEAEGRGESEPIADNETSDGRAENRRTEVKLIRGE